MGQFLWFVETERGAVGSGDVPSVAGLLRCMVSRRVEVGPGGKPGLLLHEADAPMARCQVRAGAQRWEFREEVPGVGRVYTGMWKDWRPSEGELRRDAALVPELESAFVRFSGSEVWLLPMLRTNVGASRLPKAAGVDEGGRLVWSAVEGLEDWEERGRLLWETAMATLGFREASGPVLDAAGLLSAVYDGLGIFYRVGRSELNLLQLFPGQGFMVAAFAMVEVDLYKVALRLEGEVGLGKGRPVPSG